MKDQLFLIKTVLDYSVVSGTVNVNDMFFSADGKQGGVRPC